MQSPSVGAGRANEIGADAPKNPSDVTCATRIAQSPGAFPHVTVVPSMSGNVLWTGNGTLKFPAASIWAYTLGCVVMSQ